MAETAAPCEKLQVKCFERTVTRNTYLFIANILIFHIKAKKWLRI